MRALQRLQANHIPSDALDVMHDPGDTPHDFHGLRGEITDTHQCSAIAQLAFDVILQRDVQVLRLRGERQRLARRVTKGATRCCRVEQFVHALVKSRKVLPNRVIQRHVAEALRRRRPAHQEACQEAGLARDFAALVRRIFFALIVTWLMGIVGLIFAGGLLLLWVSWKFWREIREGADNPGSEEIDGDERSGIKSGKSFVAAAWAVAVADVSMSLDNVLAVAGAAREHPGILVIGLLLSVAMMGLAANFIARIINRHRWIAYIGLAVIVLVAFKMIYEGWTGTSDTLGIITLFR